MDVLTMLSVINYALVLLYGLFLSVHISGGWSDNQAKKLVYLLCPLFLLLQGLCWLLWGIDVTRRIYPLVIHLPLVLTLMLVLKKKFGVALISVCTAYLCCQLPRWVKLLIIGIGGSALTGEIGYMLAIFLAFWLLWRYFVRIAHDAMTYSRQNLVLFGSLPCVYYVFDYATVIYSNALYMGIPALTEFFPTAIILFYVLFLVAYHAQTQRRMQAELQSSVLERELKQSGTELEALRHMETQTAIYQHDMRHHLTAISGFLSVGDTQQAQQYIQKVQSDVETITPKRFCENELINLLCSSFLTKAERNQVRLSVNARIPKSITISDTELCSLLSNALENALHAAQQMEEQERWVELYCGMKRNNLLIEVKNPYGGVVEMQDGVPVSRQAGHGYGCRSILAIAQQHHGHCSFEARGGLFTLQVILPMRTDMKI